MRNRTIYAAVLLAILSMSAACDKTPQLPSEYSTDPDTVLIDAYVGALTRSNPLGENQTRFNAGDRISVVHTSANKQVDYTYDGTSWIPVGDDYLVWQTDKKNTFRIQYPFIGYESVFGEYFKNQSTLEEMSKSDLMEAVVDVDPIPSDRRLVAELKRQRSLVTVKIVGFNDEFSNDQKITDLKLHLWDGGQGGEIISVTPYIQDEKGVAQPAGTVGRTGYSYTAIGRNDCDYRGNAFITLTVAGKDLTVANPAPMEIGKRYTYELTVGKGAVRIAGVTVEDWTTGVTLDGKFEAEVDNYSEWDGKKVTYTHYFYGEGTSESPYLIKSAADLAGLAANVNGGEAYSNKYFRLETNIDLMGHEWTPIGDNDKNGFSGIFDGGGCSIINLNISKPYTYSGLFGVLDGGEIKNLDLKNCHIGSKGCFSGLLVAYMRSAKVEDCNVQGEITVTAATVWDYYCGGIVGKVVYFEESDEKCVISDCEAEVNISPASEILTLFSGGIVGQFDAGTIEDCKTRGKIAGIHVGGIAGSIHADDSIKDRNRSIIKRCDSYAVVIGNEDSSVLGGFIGHAAYCTISSCFVYGTIDASEFKVFMKNLGGSFGVCKDNVSVTDFHFHGNIILPIEKGDYYGAFIGWLSGGSLQTKNCTYDESGVGGLKLIGKIDSGIELGEQDIKGI